MNNKVLWLTGLSGSGKSTLAEMLKKDYPNIVLLDGDVLRNDLCNDLGFSDEDRIENMRRLRALCRLFVKEGKDVVTAFISPFESERIKARDTIPNCHIVYIKTSLEVCEARDVKGLYKKARSGIIPNFTGIGSPFEEPENPDLVVNTTGFVLNSYRELENYWLII